MGIADEILDYRTSSCRMQTFLDKCRNYFHVNSTRSISPKEIGRVIDDIDSGKIEELSLDEWEARVNDSKKYTR